MIMITLCPCGSNKKLSECCGRFLSGEQHAKTPEQLVRSRYTAHVLGGYGDYLVSTWWAAVELGFTAQDFSAHSVNWCKLDVLDKMQQGDYGEVEFKAYFQKDAGANFPQAEKRSGTFLEVQQQVHHERSSFKRVDGRWYYVEAMTPP